MENIVLMSFKKADTITLAGVLACGHIGKFAQ
jgi:hypothetical protein